MTSGRSRTNAFRLDPEEYRQLATTNLDLDPLRSDPSFIALMRDMTYGDIYGKDFVMTSKQLLFDTIGQVPNSISQLL